MAPAPTSPRASKDDEMKIGGSETRIARRTRSHHKPARRRAEDLTKSFFELNINGGVKRRSTAEKTPSALETTVTSCSEQSDSSRDGTPRVATKRKNANGSRGKMNWPKDIIPEPSPSPSPEKPRARPQGKDESMREYADYIKELPDEYFRSTRDDATEIYKKLKTDREEEKIKTRLRHAKLLRELGNRDTHMDPPRVSNLLEANEANLYKTERISKAFMGAREHPPTPKSTQGFDERDPALRSHIINEIMAHTIRDNTARGKESSSLRAKNMMDRIMRAIAKEVNSTKTEQGNPTEVNHAKAIHRTANGRVKRKIIIDSGSEGTFVRSKDILDWDKRRDATGDGVHVRGFTSSVTQSVSIATPLLPPF